MRPVLRLGRGSAAQPPGVVLVLTVLLVGLMMVMGTTMINLAGSDFQIANNESKSIQALYNADAGLEEVKMRLSPSLGTDYYDPTSNPTGKRIPVIASPDWRVYLLSGHTQAEIQGGLDGAYAKRGPDYTATEGTTNYRYMNTIQTSNQILWGWARVEYKRDGAGNIIYYNPLGDPTASPAVPIEVATATQTVSGTTINNPPIFVITAEGIQGSVRRVISAEYRPNVLVTWTTDTIIREPFANAVHGRGVVNLSGNGTTDSYNSNDGPYGGSNVLSNGDVSTDRVGSGSITIGANATVNGSVLCGPTCNTSTDVVVSGHVSGSISQEPNTLDMPLPVIPAGVTNQGALSITGNRDVTLNAGTYWFSSIHIAGNGRLRTSGQVKIYVTGNVDIGGNGVIAANNAPPNLLIYGTSTNPTNPTAPGASTCTSVSIHGNGSFVGAIYAPNADISLVGNAATYGSLSGNTVTITGNGEFHYDEALGMLDRQVTTTTTIQTNMTGYNRFSWREIPF
ncbi:MAG: hypothetical protein ACE147_03335 [Candidatus Methylomirabilales bacterium]